jgi:hypothetical protein
VLSLSLSTLVGCKDEATQYREDHEKSLPALTPYLDALKKASSTPIAAPECGATIDTPAVLFDSASLRDNLAGKGIDTIEQQMRTDLEGPGHPCGLFRADELALLDAPFDPKKSHAGSNGPHRSAYAIAGESLTRCLTGVRSIVVLERGATVSPKADATATSFYGGSMTSTLRVYGAKGEPKCVARITTESSPTVRVSGRTQAEADRSLIASLSVGHRIAVEERLGKKK